MGGLTNYSFGPLARRGKGNFCYVNSAIQMLVANKPFADAFIATKGLRIGGDASPLLLELWCAVRCIHGYGHLFTTNELRAMLCQGLEPTFAVLKQQDAGEFLTDHLLPLLDRLLKEHEPGNTLVRDHFGDNDNLVAAVVVSAEHGDGETLQARVEQSLASSRAEVAATSPHGKAVDLPLSLIVLIDRLVCGDGGLSRKNCASVPGGIPDVVVLNSPNGGQQRYELMGVVLHELGPLKGGEPRDGVGLGQRLHDAKGFVRSGHFIAIAKRDGEVYRVDDDVVSTVPEDQVGLMLHDQGQGAAGRRSGWSAAVAMYRSIGGVNGFANTIGTEAAAPVRLPSYLPPLRYFIGPCQRSQSNTRVNRA